MAGQIPLIPPSLTLPAPQSFSTEVALSLKHVQSIWAALKEGTGGSALGESFVEGCICWIDPVGWKDGGLTGARTGWSAWLEKVRRVWLIVEGMVQRLTPYACLIDSMNSRRPPLSRRQFCLSHRSAFREPH